MKNLVKTKVNLVDMKIGITTYVGIPDSSFTMFQMN